MDSVVVVWTVSFITLLGLKGVAGQWLHARASGWPRLSRRYPTDGRRRCRNFERTVIRVQSHWYHQAPVVGVDGVGIRLTMQRVFRPFHPPVFIPWDDVSAGDLTADGTLPLRVGESSQLLLTGPVARAVSGLLARRAHGTGQRSG